MKHPISTLPYEMNSVIEAGTDLNDYRTAGIYFFSYANRPSNLPPDGYGNGWCIVFPSSINSENYCTQIWISFGNNTTTDARNKPMARRTYFNGTWTDWWKLPCTGEYTSPTDVTDAITTALADYIPRNTTEVTATTEAEFEQTLEELPQSPPKIYFFHVLQGTSTRIGLPTGRYGIEVYTMGSTLRTVIAYSYNNDQKTYKKIRTAGTSGSWSSWIDITNTDTVTNLGTTVTNLGTQVETNTNNITSINNRIDSLEGAIDSEHMGYAQYNFTVDNGGLAELFPGGYSTSNLEITRFVVAMSGQICNISMTVKLKNSFPADSTMPTPTMSNEGFYTSQADNGKIFLGKNTSKTGSYPTFELLTYATMMRNTTGSSIASNSQIQTSWSMVVAPTFKSLATRWAAYKVKNPT